MLGRKRDKNARFCGTYGRAIRFFNGVGAYVCTACHRFANIFGFLLRNWQARIAFDVRIGYVGNATIRRKAWAEIRGV